MTLYCDILVELNMKWHQILSRQLNQLTWMRIFRDPRTRFNNYIMKWKISYNYPRKNNQAMPTVVLWKKSFHPKELMLLIKIDHLMHQIKTEELKEPKVSNQQQLISYMGELISRPRGSIQWWRVQELKGLNLWQEHSHYQRVSQQHQWCQ